MDKTELWKKIEKVRLLEKRSLSYKAEPGEPIVVTFAVNTSMSSRSRFKREPSVHYPVEHAIHHLLRRYHCAVGFVCGTRGAVILYNPSGKPLWFDGRYQTIAATFSSFVTAKVLEIVENKNVIVDTKAFSVENIEQAALALGLFAKDAQSLVFNDLAAHKLGLSSNKRDTYNQETMKNLGFDPKEYPPGEIYGTFLYRKIVDKDGFITTTFEHRYHEEIDFADPVSQLLPKYTEKNNDTREEKTLTCSAS